jgi:hypothetical protein
MCTKAIVMPSGMISITWAYLEKRPCICIEMAPLFLSLPPIVEVIFGLRVDMKDVRMNIAFGGGGISRRILGK